MLKSKSCSILWRIRKEKTRLNQIKNLEEKDNDISDSLENNSEESNEEEENEDEI